MEISFYVVAQNNTVRVLPDQNCDTVTFLGAGGTLDALKEEFGPSCSKFVWNIPSALWIPVNPITVGLVKQGARLRMHSGSATI